MGALARERTCCVLASHFVKNETSNRRLPADFQKIFSNLYGKPCWQVRPGYGSFLTLEFGKPHLEIRDIRADAKSRSSPTKLGRRSVVVHGDWHLWICCCEWDVRNRQRLVGDSSKKSRVQSASNFLDGQKLTRFSIAPKTFECAFHFDLGAVLRTRPYDRHSDQWLLYEPSHRVLVLRADGYYKYARSDAPDNSQNWQQLFTASPRAVVERR